MRVSRRVWRCEGCHDDLWCNPDAHYVKISSLVSTSTATLSSNERSSEATRLTWIQTRCSVWTEQSHHPHSHFWPRGGGLGLSDT